jgi:hypothetical protein
MRSLVALFTSSEKLAIGEGHSVLAGHRLSYAAGIIG